MKAAGSKRGVCLTPRRARVEAKDAAEKVFRLVQRQGDRHLWTPGQTQVQSWNTSWGLFCPGTLQQLFFLIGTGPVGQYLLGATRQSTRETCSAPRPPPQLKHLGTLPNRRGSRSLDPTCEQFPFAAFQGLRRQQRCGTASPWLPIFLVRYLPPMRRLRGHDYTGCRAPPKFALASLESLAIVREQKNHSVDPPSLITATVVAQ